MLSEKPSLSKREIDEIKEEFLHLISVSATLAGLCITAVALMNNLGKHVLNATIVDDMFAICALFFLVCVYLIFFALRSSARPHLLILKKLVNATFLFAMTFMTFAAFVMVYTVW